MEDVLEVYRRPYDEDYPVICMDEKPVQLFADFRKGFRSKKDGVPYEDYQYIRNGTASIFLFAEPLVGWRYADAQERRTAQDWAKQIEWLLTKQYPMAKKIILVMDNLNTHSIASLYATFPPQRARDLASAWRFIIRQSTGVGLILRRLSYPLLADSALQTTEFLIFLHFGVCSNRGLLQETFSERRRLAFHH